MKLKLILAFSLMGGSSHSRGPEAPFYASPVHQD
jgi:hypothetical protein